MVLHIVSVIGSLSHGILSFMKNVLPCLVTCSTFYFTYTLHVSYRHSYW